MNQVAWFLIETGSLCYNKPMFIGQAEIEVKSCKGGDGMVHFHREKYVPRGGSDGGKGGDMVLVEVK